MSCFHFISTEFSDLFFDYAEEIFSQGKGWPSIADDWKEEQSTCPILFLIHIFT